MTSAASSTKAKAREPKPKAPSAAGATDSGSMPLGGLSDLPAGTLANYFGAGLAGGEAGALMDGGDPLAAKPSFLTEPDSPFSDGYSIRLETEALADFLSLPEEQRNEKHPDFWRWAELEERQSKLEQRGANYERRLRADPLVEEDTVDDLKKLGSLVAEEQDSMVVHTKEGFRMFMGRGRDPKGAFAAIIGVTRNAASLRALWTLTAMDNPYADWALVLHEQHRAEIMKMLKEATNTGLHVLAGAQAIGLNYSVLRSAEPKKLQLGFKSPYGFGMAEMVVTFDYFVRVWKTLEYRDLRSTEQVRAKIHEVLRFARSRMMITTRFERWLMRPELQTLTRADFLPGLAPEAQAEAQKRMDAAIGIFGHVPVDIFVGKLAPRHSRRRTQLSAQDRQVLQAVSAQMAAAEAAQERADADAPELL